jgi:hypothetical protein
MSHYSIKENEAAFTGFLISLPKNEKLLKAINKIVANVKNKYYGTSPYHPTGPYLLGECFDYEEKKFYCKKIYWKSGRWCFNWRNNYIKYIS